MLLKSEGSSVLRAAGFECIYGVAHFGKSLLWHTSQILFAYFLTEACGLSPYMMGLILTGTLLLNALADLAAGRLTARLPPGPAPLQRLQSTGAFLSCLGLVLTALSPFISSRPLPALGIVGLSLFSIAYALVDVPQNAMLGLAFKTRAKRTAAASARLFLSGAAQLLVVLAFVPMMRGLDGHGLAGRFLLFSLAISGAAIITALWLRHAAPPQEAQGSIDALAEAAAQPPMPGLGLLLAMMALFSLTTTSVAKLEPYIASFWFQSAGDSAAFMVAIAIGGMAAQPLWAWRTRNRSHLCTLHEAAGVLALGGFGFYASATGTLGAFGSGFLYGAGQGGVAMLLWSLLAEASQSAPRKAASSFAAFTFVSKSAGAFSTLLLSHALAASRYQTAAADLSQLVLLITLVPACGAAGLAALSFNRRAKPAQRPTDETPEAPALNGPTLPATHPRMLPSGSQS